MFNPLNLEAPYDECQVINNCLQAYNTWPPNDEQLDLLREIQRSGNYYWQGLAIPSAMNRLVPANGTINGTAILPAGSYITSITSYAAQETQDQRVNPGGFKFKIYDKGTKASIFYGDYALDRIVTSDMQVNGIYQFIPSDLGSNLDMPFGPAYVMSPFIVTGPGVLGWEIVNLSASANLIQLMLSCAIPINTRSIGNMIVNKR